MKTLILFIIASCLIMSLFVFISTFFVGLDFAFGSLGACASICVLELIKNKESNHK